MNNRSSNYGSKSNKSVKKKQSNSKDANLSPSKAKLMFVTFLKSFYAIIERIYIYNSK